MTDLRGSADNSWPRRITSSPLIWIVLFAFRAAAASLDPLSVAAAAEYSDSNHGTSFLVIQDGRTLVEQDAGTPRKIYSGTKAFWGLAALAATEDGLLSLDGPVADSLPEWRDGNGKSRIVIRQLLDFSSGLEPAFSLQNTNPANRDAIAIRLPIIAEPGTAFIYGPSSMQVFHEVLRNRLGRESPTHYLERRVLKRVGLGPQRYIADRFGNPLLATGFSLSAREWSRLGKLVLAYGAPVLSRRSLEQCWRGSSANPAFSLGWWNNRAAPSGREVDVEQMLSRTWHSQEWHDACLCRDAPGDLVACVGSAHQRLYVIPSMHLIVVRHGAGGSFSDGRFLRLLLNRERA